jgi:hypothetical protein
MLAAGLDFAKSIMSRQSWADTFIKQWTDIEMAAQQVGCLDKLHIWPDPSLKGFISEDKVNNWLYRPTIEKWNSK